MNKRKRVATLKHRRRRIRYEVLRKAAIAAGGATIQTVRRRVRPQAVGTTQEIVASTAVAPQEAAVVVATETAAEAPAPARRSRRATPQPAEATATPATEEAAEAPAPAPRARRTTTRQPKATTPSTTEEPAESEPTRKRRAAK
ncbi:MAG: hypothetical protein V3S37_05095 [Dehalococcoidia bacterium]